MTTLADLKTHIEVIEETYEFMLGYAAQGLEGDEASKSGGQLRTFLGKTVDVIDGLSAEFRDVVGSEGLEPKDAYDDFIDVLEKDAAASGAALKLVLAQKSISSQLVDNLNASIHLRALLTDIFVVDEVIKLSMRK